MLSSELLHLRRKKVNRLMFNIRPQESCRKIFKDYRSLTFPCIFMLKCFLSVRCNLNRLMRCSDFHKNETRYKNIICVPQHKMSKYESTPSLAGITFYSHLPDRFKVSNDIHFRKEIKKLFLRNVFIAVLNFCLVL